MLRSSASLVLSCLLLASCQKETEVERANRDKILLIGNGNDPKALDPHLVTGVPESKVIGAIFEGLVGDDPASDTAYPPGAATSWTHNADYTSWTFHLRPDARWSDNLAPVVAQDFVFAYHRLLHPDLAGPYAEMLYFLKNAEDYNKNHRSIILARAGLIPGVSEAQVKGFNLEGLPDKTIKDDLGKSPKWAELSEPNRRRLVLNKGLDALDRPALNWILEAPDTRFEWPADSLPDQRRSLLTTLASKAADPTANPAIEAEDLFDLARVGATSSDDYTLQVDLREPVPYLPGITRHYTWFPVPRHVVLQWGKISDRFTPWSEASHLVGNGAFKMKSWRLNDSVEVVKNPIYWDAANVKLNGLKFYPIENYYSETRAFLAGQLHTTYQVPPDLVDRIKKEYPQYLRQEPYVSTSFVRFNVTRPGLDNVKIRQALSLAINRKDICDTILEGYTPAGTITPAMGDYKPAQIAVYDLEKAKAMLAEAGYPDGRGADGNGLKFSLLIRGGGSQAVSEAMQSMWKKIGITVDIRRMDFGSYISAQQNLDFDIAIAGWTGDYLDPTTFLLMWTEGNGNNNTGWHSAKFEGLLHDAAIQTDPSQRLARFAQAEQLLMEEAPIAPFAFQARNYLHRPEVKGWHPLLLDNHPYSAVRIDP